jgi:hypothetical protein
MKLRFLYLLFFVLFFADVKAQKMIVIDDEENNFQFTIKGNDILQVKKDGETTFTKYQIRNILDYGFTCFRGNKTDTIKFSQINSIRIRPDGSFKRSFFAFAGIAGIIDLMIIFHDFSSGGNPTAYLIGAPVTLVVLPVIGAAIFRTLIFPKQKIGFSGKYKWKIIN